MGVDLDDMEARVCMVDDMKADLTPLAIAYARARCKCVYVPTLVVMPSTERAT